MLDPVSVAYFEAREKAMHEVGLNPDNDDEWATPDFDFGHEVEVDGFVFGSSADEYDFDAWTLCQDCFEQFVAPGEILCAICEYDHKRKGLAA